MGQFTSDQITAMIQKTIAEGAPLYNVGNIQGCACAYLQTAQELMAMIPSESLHQSKLLQDAIDAKQKTNSDNETAWILRRCFDALLEANKSGKNESLDDLLKRTMQEGAPLYNEGDHKGCYEMYIESAKYACGQEQRTARRSVVGQLLDQATDEAMILGKTGDYGEAAWVLRRCFDSILSQSKSKRAFSISSKDLMGSSDMPPANDFQTSSDSVSVSDDDGYWQDEKAENTSDFEIGTCISDIAFLLRASVNPATHKRFAGKSYDDSFQGSEAVEVLTGLGLAKDRKAAIIKCTMLLSGSFIIAVSHESEESFHDGTHLYRFPDHQELEASYNKLIQEGPKDGQHPEGSLLAQLVLALQNTLELPGMGDTGSASTNSDGLPKKQQPRELSTVSPDHARGISIASFAMKAEAAVDIKDRTHRLKKYEKCFVGKDVVSKLMNLDIVASNEEGLRMMKELSDVGLIHHVLYEHGFEESHLFYRFTSSSDLRRSLDALAILPNAPMGQELIRQTALQTRYQQFASIDVDSILNSFFGCDNKEGWDLVDLQNWRNNMKRWGFGRREDQDNVMVEMLSPLALIVDPVTWYDNLSDEERGKWESPWGILAQIAIFDQVPRSAFRGTPEAFKWDDLAIKASKVAVDRGYFETAYKSTLNQFLVLLPFEHSELWEDQKLGVSLLLRLLSTVAVEDDGLSDYEIVKRLEFSKRLSVAFLEHAQVVKQFHRYPHRNAAHGRTTSIEERVWLASDLVPRWAKSQNKDESKNRIQLPVIPLKRLIKK